MWLLPAASNTEYIYQVPFMGPALPFFAAQNLDSSRLRTSHHLWCGTGKHCLTEDYRILPYEQLVNTVQLKLLAV